MANSSQPPIPTSNDRPEAKLDEYAAIGINVGAKLKKMNPNQQVYAEFLINKVFAMGFLGQLSGICDVSRYPEEHQATRVPNMPPLPSMISTPNMPPLPDMIPPANMMPAPDHRYGYNSSHQNNH